MASCDYRKCDNCGGKTFYDSDLHYEYFTEKWDEERGICYYDVSEGSPTLFNNSDKPGVRLYGVGAWAVLCEECSKTHEAVIKLKETQC